MLYSKDTPFAALTLEQVKEFLDEYLNEREKAKQLKQSQSQSPKRLVYGLQGLRKLLHVSTPTALKLKNTVLKDAIFQQGRTIIVDVDLALELFKNRKRGEY